MNALSIVNKVVSLVSLKMHKTRRNAVTACVKSLLNGSAATVTSIGRGINTKAFESGNTSRPVISIDWSDLDDRKAHFLLRAAISLKGRPITLYQEVHCNKTKEKPATHKTFLKTLHTILPSHCRPVIVTDAGYKSPWFREVRALGWDIVGRIRKPHRLIEEIRGNVFVIFTHKQPVDRSVSITAK